MSAFEFSYRWSQIAATGLANSVDILEARDQALEQHIADFSCMAENPYKWGYPTRWSQLVGLNEADQVALLEERDRSLEQFFFMNGSCPIEMPYRWDQVLPGLIRGESWATACLEENDRTVESIFDTCTCGGLNVVFRTPVGDEGVPPNYETTGFWGDAESMGYTELTLTRITMDMRFYPTDVCYAFGRILSDFEPTSICQWGEGSYGTTGIGLPVRADVLNLPDGASSILSLDETNAGPYPALRSPLDPYFHPLTDFITGRCYDLLSGPQSMTVDSSFGLFVDLLPDYGNIPGFPDPDNGPTGMDNSILAPQGNITFHFAEEGDEQVIVLH